MDGAEHTPLLASPSATGGVSTAGGAHHRHRHMSALDVTVSAHHSARRLRRRTTLLGSGGRVNHAPMGLFSSFLFLR
jgi:hypothetical protein